VGSQKSISGIVKRKFLTPVAPAHEKEAQEESGRMQHVCILGVLLSPLIKVAHTVSGTLFSNRTWKRFNKPWFGICLWDLSIVLFVFFFFFYFIIFYIYSHVYTSFELTPSTPLPSRTCSTLLFSDFVEEKNISDKKKDIAFANLR
jgi:hypothetical protein